MWGQVFTSTIELVTTSIPKFCSFIYNLKIMKHASTSMEKISRWQVHYHQEKQNRDTCLIKSRIDVICKLNLRNCSISLPYSSWWDYWNETQPWLRYMVPLVQMKCIVSNNPSYYIHTLLSYKENGNTKTLKSGSLRFLRLTHFFSISSTNKHYKRDHYIISTELQLLVWFWSI